MRALVTGGGGFLGSAIVRRLVARGDQVRSLARGEYPELAALGVECVRGNLADPDGGAIARAAEGMDVVFHVAALAGVGGPPEIYQVVNVDGTRHVVQACRTQRVPKLVFTSTPSVVHDQRGIEGGTEDLPYPDRYLAPYPASKADAEVMVLAANGPGLATVALRPHLMLGPGDPHLVPRLLARHRAGRLKRIGDQECRVDWTDVDDAAAAHVAACDRLLSHESPPAGRAYFLSQDAPEPLWELIDRILVACGEQPVTGRVSATFAYAAGAVLEKLHELFGGGGEPQMSRFVAHQLSTAHWFDIGAARRDLGYDPRVTLEQELERIGAWVREKGI